VLLHEQLSHVMYDVPMTKVVNHPPFSKKDKIYTDFDRTARPSA